MEGSSVMSGLMQQLKVENKRVFDTARYQNNVEEFGLLSLLNYYCSNGTIDLSEYIRLKEMTESPDKENIEVVKQVLQFKYNLL